MSRAIVATLQVELAVRGVVSFFEAQFALSPDEREDACNYLRVELPKHPAVRLE